MGHVQTIGKINAIVTLRAGPPPPLNVMDFISYKKFNPHSLIQYYLTLTVSINCSL